jgi:hypothetical protein
MICEEEEGGSAWSIPKISCQFCDKKTEFSCHPNVCPNLGLQLIGCHICNVK